jgi:hypothetical protein
MPPKTVQVNPKARAVRLNPSLTLPLNFGEFPFRDCPKRVRGACPVALQSTKTALFDPFLPPSTSKFALRALFVPLFGQSLHALG